MGKGSSNKPNKNKPIRSENENIIRRENGSVVLRKEKIFTDGSRLVEESFIEGSELQSIDDIEASIPLVPASAYGGGIPPEQPRATSVATGTSAKSSSGGMLKPAYDPDGNIYGVVAMMFCRYGGYSFVLWILVRIIQRIVLNNVQDDDDYYTAFNSASFRDDDRWGWGNN